MPRVVPEDVLGFLWQRVGGGWKLRPAAEATARERSPEARVLVLTTVLTQREVQVLTLAARGATNRDIAASLHVSEATIKTHLLHAFGKLGVSDRTAAVAVALEQHLIRLHPPSRPSTPP
jgi:DNA-binding NarL/FixJ family response regulator